MTDHKFAGDDVIKALECCKGEDIPCKSCPYFDLGSCESAMAQDALDLINRQKREIERLQAVHADMTESLRLAAEANKDMQAKIDRLKKGKKNIKFETGDYAKIADNKSGHSFELGTIVKLEKHDEDYKAFANDDYWWVTDDDLVEVDNDTLVKEMTEEGK